MDRACRLSRPRMWAVTRPTLLLAVVLALVISGMIALALWVTPPGWLAGARKLTVMALGWARIHLLTVTVVGLAVSIAGLSVPLLLRRLGRRDAVAQQRQARDRQVMLARVRHRWITGVLDQSLTNQIPIRLGLTRRTEAVWQPDIMLRRPGQPAEPLPADTPISAVFDQLGGGLLILGPPGAGKTTALLELARDLLDRAVTNPGEPIPTVFNLSSWAARRPPLDQWLIDELHNRYSVPRSIGAQWLSASEVLPLLDGLDEVVTAHRADCVETINAFLREHGLVRVVVCSRTQEYTTLAAPLQVEEAVELHPATRQQIADYLAAASGALADVQAAVEADPSLWELLSSPLALNVVALTYQDQPADALRAIGIPHQRLALLFNAYTERMLTHRPGRYSPAQTRHWLACLARSMHARGQSEFHLDRLAPDWLPTTAAQRLATLSPAISVGLVAGTVSGLLNALFYGLFDGLFFGLVTRLRKAEPAEEAGRSRPKIRVALIAGLVYGLINGLGYGLIDGPVDGLCDGLLFGLFAGLFAGLIRTEPVEEIGWSWLRVRVALHGGLIAGLVGGMLYGLVDRLIFGLIFGLILGLFFALLSGLVPRLVSERTAPNEGIHRSIHYALAIGLVAGLITGLIVGLVSGSIDGLFFGLFFALAGGLVFGGLACLQHLAVRILLAAHGFAPWRYVRFLDEVTERLFLRRAGSGYIFVHRLLLEYFAGLESISPAAKISNLSDNFSKANAPLRSRQVFARGVR